MRSFINIFNFLLILSATFISCKISKEKKNEDNKIIHVKVYYEAGTYGGWPANWGMWSWNNELLVGFTQADHEDKSGHAFNEKSSLAKFARSLDGGNSWSIEDAFDNGITEATVEHNIGDKSIPARELSESIDFLHPDLALTFRMITKRDGPSSFYYSYNRGNNWNGAFKLSVDFPGRNPAGIVTRTDYIIDGEHELTAFLTVGFREGDKDWREVAVVRTNDGGKSWKHLSWIGPQEINSIMPSSVRLSKSKIISIIRRTSPPRMVCFLSEDNGYNWTQLDDPVKIDANGHPPALLKLNDNRLCLIYLLRNEDTNPNGIGLYVTYSSNEGQSWTRPFLLRGNDSANWDIGYPRAVQLPGGKVIAVYYYNNVNGGDEFRYIAATIFEPKKEILSQK